jgi:uncharacterized protein (TIGR00369 family)
VLSNLPPETPFTTSELSLRVLAPARVGASVRADGRLIQGRRTLALSEVSITDERGLLIAHGSSLCFVLPSGAPAPEPKAEDQAEPPDPVEPPVPAQTPGPATTNPETPDPWERPPQGATIPQEVWDSSSGLEILEAQLRGELPAPPIHHLTGLTLTAASESGVTFEMPASPWLCAPARGRVQGGAVALLAEAALSGAIQATLPAGTALAPVDLKVNYLRPLAADGRWAVARGRVVHAGRRIAVASSEVLDADRKPVAVATGSAMVLPGRPASLGAAAAELANP